MKLTQIFLQIEKELIAGTFALPALPAVALNVRKAVKDPLMDLQKLATVVSLDSSFSNYLISLANSPIYRGVGNIDSVSIALGRMGMQSTRTTALIFAVRSLFQTKGQACKKLLNRVWMQSCKISAFSYVIADKLKVCDPERASLGGMLHNVGMIPILIKLFEQGNDEQSVIQNWDEISLFSKKISVRILSYWGIGDDLKAVANGVYEWQAQHHLLLVDLVNLAIWHSRLGSKSFRTLPNLDQLGYFKSQPMLKLNNGESLMFVKESEQEINQMMQALIS